MKSMINKMTKDEIRVAEIVLGYLKDEKNWRKWTDGAIAFHTGLCLFVYTLHRENRLNLNELDIILNWIRIYRPEGTLVGEYYYPTGDIDSRINWLEGRLRK